MVHHPEVGVVRARMVNHSEGGLLIELGLSVPRQGCRGWGGGGDLVQLCGGSFPLKALIVHSRDGQAGLRFAGGRRHRELARELGETLEASTLVPAAAGAVAAKPVGRVV